MGLPLSNTKEADMAYGAHRLRRKKRKKKRKVQAFETLTQAPVLAFQTIRSPLPCVRMHLL